MPGSSDQLPLAFGFNDQQLFANFVPGVNGELLSRLELDFAGPHFVGLWLWGAAGSGVTHLLNATCQQLGSQGQRAGLLPLAELPRDPDALSGLATWDLVAIDDVQTWLGHRDCELALLGLFETLRGAGGKLLVGAGQPAADCSFALPDLGSRLGGLVSYRVAELDDAAKASLLRDRAAQRGLLLSDQVLRFWLARSERSLPTLLAQLEQIDAAAWQGQRAVTVPLLKAVLKL